MAKASAIFFNLALIFSLLSLNSMAEGRIFTLEYQFPKSLAPLTPKCEGVHGVKTNETCFSVQQDFKLSPEEFGAINPNLVCEKLFVGQWLCVAGSA